MVKGFARGGGLGVVAALTLALLGGCLPSGPLVELRAGRQTVAADGREAPLALTYSLSQPATVDLYALQANQPPRYLRQGEQRPAGRDYQYPFDGTYPLPDSPDERRVLPDGRYRLVLKAATADGRQQEAATEVTIRNADTSPPEIADLAAFPTTISPNFDGQDDAASITFRLTKRARVALDVTNERGRRVYVGPQAPREPGEYREQWDGLDNKQVPLPDGAYQLN